MRAKAGMALAWRAQRREIANPTAKVKRTVCRPSVPVLPGSGRFQDGCPSRRCELPVRAGRSRIISTCLVLHIPVTFASYCQSQLAAVQKGTCFSDGSRRAEGASVNLRKRLHDAIVESVRSSPMVDGRGRVSGAGRVRATSGRPSDFSSSSACSTQFMIDCDSRFAQDPLLSAAGSV